MKILIIDSKEATNQINKLNEMLKLNWETITPSNLEEAYKIYNNDIDFLIVDFTLNENRLYLEEIIKDNPTQKTITISSKLSCSNQFGCENCIKHLQRKRILAPIELTEVYDTIINFDNSMCKYYNGFDNIMTILPDILSHKYNQCKYNTETNKIQCCKNNIAEFIEIVNLLDKYNVTYEIEEDYLISIK